MPSQVRDYEWTERNHQETAPANVVESPGYELGRDALALDRRVDLGVHELHPPGGFAVVDESDDVGPNTGLIAPLAGVVRDSELAGRDHLATLARGCGVAERSCAGRSQARTCATEMEDSQIHNDIEQLVQEEHDLWQRESAGSATDEDRRRLESIKVSLDQSWDLLRQRRALREAGGDPDAADVRGVNVVEGYEQ